MSIQILLWIIACVLFSVKVFVSPARVDIGALGLAFLAAGFIAGGLDTAS